LSALAQLDVVDYRKLTGRKRRQRKTAAPGAHRNAIARLLEFELAAVRQRTADVEQLARRYRNLAGFEILCGC
jgi:hypothetical protein